MRPAKRRQVRLVGQVVAHHVLLVHLELRVHHQVSTLRAIVILNVSLDVKLLLASLILTERRLWRVVLLRELSVLEQVIQLVGMLRPRRALRLDSKSLRSYDELVVRVDLGVDLNSRRLFAPFLASQVAFLLIQDLSEVLWLLN